MEVVSFSGTELKNREAAIQGIKTLELKDSEADTKKCRICVEGYDISLPRDFVTSALRNHFSSCGEITNICIPRFVGSDILNSTALVSFLGEDALGKALKLHESDVGGWKVLVKSCPFEGKPNPEFVAKIAESFRTSFGYWIGVTGCDTSLPNDEMKSLLTKHFSSCGKVTEVVERSSKVRVYIQGEKDLTEKALKLSGGGCGCDVEGCKIAAEKVVVKRAQDCRVPFGLKRPKVIKASYE